jgi:MFS family permease
VISAAGHVRSRWILAAVSTALFCVQIDYFAMNLALPRMASDLGSSTADLQWVISVYMLALGAFMVPAGRIGDIFGRRRALLAGIALFGIASVLCAVAPSAAVVIGFRAVQGLGAAFIFPVSVSVLTNAFPSGQSSHAIGLAYGIAGLGNAAGPLVGGLLTDTVGWRAIFWMLVPLSAVSLLIGVKTIPETSDKTVPRRLDLSGLTLITVGIGLFTFAFDRAPSWGWLSAPTVVSFTTSVFVLAGSRQWVVYLVALTACGFTMGLVYAFTTVATQTVVAPERAGEAAGVTLTSLVTLAGVGIAVSGTILEVLQHHGWSMANGINSILAVIAALLLPAGLAVLRSARSKAPAPGPRDAD